MSAAPEEQLEYSAAERLFRDDVERGEFAAGADRGYWQLLALDWPLAVIAIAAAAREGAPERYVLRFDLTGYPEAPAAQLWDPDAEAPLAPERWPAGGPRQTAAFNPGWKTDSIYVPVDRVPLQGHDGWRNRYAAHVWDPTGEITQYLRLIHGLINCPSYTGTRG